MRRILVNRRRPLCCGVNSVLQLRSRLGTCAYAFLSRCSPVWGARTCVFFVPISRPVALGVYIYPVGRWSLLRSRPRWCSHPGLYTDRESVTARTTRNSEDRIPICSTIYSSTCGDRAAASLQWNCKRGKWMPDRSSINTIPNGPKSEIVKTFWFLFFIFYFFF